MSASSALIATAFSQLRNAYISCIINKADPFNAVTCLFGMIAMLPPDSRPILSELEKEPERKAFIDDVDEDSFMGEAWQYVRTLSYKVEESVAKYVANVQSRRALT